MFWKTWRWIRTSRLARSLTGLEHNCTMVWIFEVQTLLSISVSSQTFAIGDRSPKRMAQYDTTYCARASMRLYHVACNLFWSRTGCNPLLTNISSYFSGVHMFLFLISIFLSKLRNLFHNKLNKYIYIYILAYVHTITL